MSKLSTTQTLQEVMLEEYGAGPLFNGPDGHLPMIWAAGLMLANGVPEEDVRAQFSRINTLRDRAGLTTAWFGLVARVDRE